MGKGGTTWDLASGNTVTIIHREPGRYRIMGSADGDPGVKDSAALEIVGCDIKLVQLDDNKPNFVIRSRQHTSMRLIRSDQQCLWTD